MKSLPFLLAIILAAVWIYTSWYWYTCNIKWFCDGQVLSTQVSENSNTSTSPQSDQAQRLTLEDVVVVWDTSEQVEVREVIEENTNDVVEENIEEVTSEEEAESQGNNDREQDNLEESDEIETQTSISLCETPLAWPIGFGAVNDENEVRKLETFLQNNYGSDVEVDGVYSEAEFELVKQFQLEYKSEVLDPWGIASPTWYVGRTSVEKINEISCQ